MDDDKLAKIRDWCKAYPLDIFPEPDFAKARALLEAGGMTLDAVSASNMRHVLQGIEKIIGESSSPSPRESEGLAELDLDQWAKNNARYIKHWWGAPEFNLQTALKGMFEITLKRARSGDRDAERYRWLKKRIDLGAIMDITNSTGGDCLYREGIDEAIDQMLAIDVAMSQQEGK